MEQQPENEDQTKQPKNEDQAKKPETENQNNSDLAKEIPTVTPENLDPLPEESEDEGGK